MLVVGEQRKGGSSFSDILSLRHEGEAWDCRDVGEGAVVTMGS